MAGRFRGWSGKPRRNKFNAKKTIVDGITFDSQREALRWMDLKLLERGGVIRGLERQVRLPIEFAGKVVKIRSEGYPNGRAVNYVADFAYFEGETRVLEDVKGMDTDISRLKRALVEAIYNVQVRITS